MVWHFSGKPCQIIQKCQKMTSFVVLFRECCLRCKDKQCLSRLQRQTSKAVAFALGIPFRNHLLITPKRCYFCSHGVNICPISSLNILQFDCFLYCHSLSVVSPANLRVCIITSSWSLIKMSKKILKSRLC